MHRLVPWTAAIAVALCIGCGDDAPSPNLRIWAPAHLAVGALVELDLQDHLASAGIHAELDEPPLAFADIEPTVREALATGTLDAELIALPWGIAQRLEADGLVTISTQLFSSDDPDQASQMLPIVLARPAAAGARVVATPPVPVFVDGCLTEASRLALGAQRVSRLAVRPDVAVVDGALQASAEELVKLAGDKVVEEGENAGKEAAVKATVLALIDYWAKRGDKYVGLSRHTAARALAIKAVGAAFKAISAVMDYKAFLELLYNSVDTHDATKDAYESALELYATASGQIVDLTAEIVTIEAGVVSCELSGADALERLDEIAGLVTNYEMHARGAIAEMVNIEGDISPHLEEMLDNILQRYLASWRRVRMAAQAKVASIADGDAIISALIADDPATDELDWETFAALLTGQPVGNVFIHSNGVLMTTSQGQTDLVRAGGALLEVSSDATEHLFGPTGQFPCGTGPVATTVCGSLEIPPGRALILAMDLAAAVPLDDAQYYHQIAAVFDGDGISSNNYRGSASYPKDLFDDTDMWFELRYAPGGTWEIHATLARGGVMSSRQTAARAFVRGSGTVFFIPTSELDLERPSYRATAFRHTGDFGLDPPHDFNGDVYPLVGEPLGLLATQTFQAPPL